MKNIKMTVHRLYGIVISALAICFITIVMPNHADTITTCDFASLKTTIETLNSGDGGDLSFDCAGTIRFTEMLKIESDVTITSADDVILDGYGQFTLFEVTGSLTLDGVTIQTGWTAVNNRGILTVTDSIFRDNQAYVVGGAIWNTETGSVTIHNTTFIGNETDEGGAIYNSGDMSITHSTFTGNSAYSGGGAISNRGNLSITDSQFSQNLTEGYSGAIDNEGLLAITNSTFDDNEAFYEGGTITNSPDGDMTIRQSIFTHNHANFGGAINTSGKSVILDSQFIGNTSRSGGAIDNRQEATIRNNFFDANSAEYAGGAIYSSDWNSEVAYNVTISHNTFTDNTAIEYGGAIYHNNQNLLSLTNNTFSTNTAQIGGAVYNTDEGVVTIQQNTFVDNGGLAGAIYTNHEASIGYNLISGAGSQCSGVYVGDIDDTNLTDSRCGGAEQQNDLMLGNFDGRIFPLLADSPAKDAYPAPCATSRDQIGVARPRADACDVGAVEWLPAGDVAITERGDLTLTDCTSEAFVDMVTLYNWVGATIMLDCPEAVTITLTMPITIYADMEIIGNNLVTLDGNNATPLWMIDATGSLTLDGMTITRGAGKNGGAIRNAGKLTLMNMTFNDNTAEFGGAIFNSGMLSIENSQFNTNHAQFGGAIYNQSTLTVVNSTFTENEASMTAGDLAKSLGQADNPQESGGAIFTVDSATITDSLFENNRASLGGGAVANDGAGKLTITNSHFLNNMADKGGAVAHVSGEEYRRLSDSCGDCGFDTYILITDSTFEGNSALDGGAIYQALTSEIHGNLFTRNVARAYGGAIFGAGDTYIYRNTFLENSADMGGAMKGGGGYNNTFVRNSATTQGGAILDASMSYSTFLDNTAPVGGAASQTSKDYTYMTLYSSLIMGDAPQCDIVKVDNLVMSNTPCGDARVVDDLMLGDFDGRVVPLLAGSPAIDVIECNGDYYSRSANDQIGTIRPQGELCDIGAVEFAPEGGAISSRQTITITDCTFDVLASAITRSQTAGGDITFDCGADATITFTRALIIRHDITLTSADTITFDGDGKTNLFVVQYSSSLTLDTITLQNGYANAEDIGGAITGYGPIILLNSTLKGNFSDQNGGAIFSHGKATITNSLFEENYATRGGGAIFSHQYSTLVISNSRFVHNESYYGGAVFHTQSNSYEYNGYKPLVTITDSVFEDNSATKGGAVSNGTLMHIRNSQFLRNHADTYGGALDTFSGDHFVEGSVFIENSANFGGAVHNGTVSNSTFVNNSATNGGGAIYESDAQYSTFLNNTTVTGGAIQASDVSYSLVIGENLQCVDMTNTDPSMTIATSECGDALVMDVAELLVGEFDGKIVPLLAGSPAIDAVAGCPNQYPIYLLTTDQIGTSRPQGEACDMGAVEFVPDES